MARKTQKNKAILFGIAIIVIASILLLVLPTFRSDDGYPKEITPDEAFERLRSGAFLLDVRQPEEWVDAHIDGATLIPLSELSGRLSEVPRYKGIIVYCRSGNRSASARDLLLEAGYNQVTSMSGGINVWINSGLPIIAGN